MNTGVSSHFLPWGIFPTQGLNPGLPHCRQILHSLSHQGSPRILVWVAYPDSRGSSWPRNWTRVSCIAGRFFISWTIREALKCQSSNLKDDVFFFLFKFIYFNWRLITLQYCIGSANGFYVTPIQPLPSVCWGLNKLKGFPGGANSKEPALANAGDVRRRFDFWVGKAPWRRSWQPTPVFSPREWTGEPGRLQSIGSQRIGHQRSDLACTQTQG